MASFVDAIHGNAASEAQHEARRRRSLVELLQSRDGSTTASCADFHAALDRAGYTLGEPVTDAVITMMSIRDDRVDYTRLARWLHAHDHGARSLKAPPVSTVEAIAQKGLEGRTHWSPVEDDFEFVTAVKRYAGGGERGGGGGGGDGGASALLHARLRGRAASVGPGMAPDRASRARELQDEIRALYNDFANRRVQHTADRFRLRLYKLGLPETPAVTRLLHRVDTGGSFSFGELVHALNEGGGVAAYQTAGAGGRRPSPVAGVRTPGLPPRGVDSRQTTSSAGGADPTARGGGGGGPRGESPVVYLDGRGHWESFGAGRRVHGAPRAAGVDNHAFKVMRASLSEHDVVTWRDSNPSALRDRKEHGRGKGVFYKTGSEECTETLEIQPYLTDVGSQNLVNEFHTHRQLRRQAMRRSPQGSPQSPEEREARLRARTGSISANWPLREASAAAGWRSEGRAVGSDGAFVPAVETSHLSRAGDSGRRARGWRRDVLHVAADAAHSNFGGHRHASPSSPDQSFVRSQLFAAVRQLDAGQLSEGGFRRALKGMGVDPVPAEVERLLRDHAAGGGVPFSAFAHAFETAGKGGHRGHHYAAGGGLTPGVQFAQRRALAADGGMRRHDHRPERSWLSAQRGASLNAITSYNTAARRPAAGKPRELGNGDGAGAGAGAVTGTGATAGRPWALMSGAERAAAARQEAARGDAAADAAWANVVASGPTQAFREERAAEVLTAKLEGLRYKDPTKLSRHLHGFSAGHGARDDGSLTRAALERCLGELNVALTPAEAGLLLRAFPYDARAGSV